LSTRTIESKLEPKEIIRRLAENPSEVNRISPREFEAVIAELLASFGWEVNLTPPTRDGGYDVLAVSKDASGLESTWIVECKRYASQNKVGVDILRQLYGIKEHLRFSNAILVTTSQFTADAKRFAEEISGLHLVDNSNLLEWFQKYKPSTKEETYLQGKIFYSCFLSYSHKDEEFTQYLYSRLQEQGIRVWFAPEDIVPGKKIHEEITKAIKLFDKLVVVLSHNSMDSEWVKTEIRKARKREHEEDRQVLFPISLIPIEEIKKWECFDADSGKDLAVEIREYLIPDMSDWRNTKSFEAKLKKIIQGLQAEKAAAIDATLQESGNIKKQESLADRKARLESEILAVEKRKLFLESEAAVTPAVDEAHRVIKQIEQMALELSTVDFPLKVEQEEGGVRIISYGFVLQAYWHLNYSNSLKYSGFYLRLLELDRKDHFGRNFHELSKLEFYFSVNDSEQYGWQATGGEKKFFTSEKLAEFGLQMILDKVGEFRRRRASEIN
jgi:hypothetical protein